MARINGTNGNDILHGTNFNDEIFGKKGQDRLFGRHGNDFLDGGDGRDRLEGGRGDDTLKGGAGIDTYVWSAGDGYDKIISQDSRASEDIIKINGTFYDYHWQIDGNDLLVGVTADDTYDFATVGGNLRIQDFFAGGDSIDYLTADLGDFNQDYSPGGGDARIYITPINGTDQGNFHELVIGSINDDIMAGGGGYRDFMWGDDGNDTMTVSNGTVGIFRGGNGDDVITGADQNDRIRGGAGSDVLDGQDGIDLVQYNSANGSVPFTHGIFANLSGSSATFDFNGFQDVTVAAGQAIDNWGDIDTLLNIENVDGSSFDDIIIGSEVSNVIEARGGSDWLEGREGADELYGGEGDDTIIGGDGDDYMVGGDGADFIQGGDGDDTIEAGAGDDSMEGGGGADALWGGEGNDIIQGGDGNDIVNAEAGDDRVFGGDGNDILTVGTFSTTETNYVEGGAGDDQLQGGFGSDFHWGGSGSDLLIDGGEGSDVFIFKNIADEGDDRIEFFKAGNFPGRDQVDLTDFGFNTFEEAMFFASDIVDAASVTGNSLLFSFENGTTLTLADVGLAFMTEDNLII